MLSLSLVSVLLFVIASGEPNPPRWPKGVYIFNASDPTYAQNTCDQVYQENGGHSPAFHGQWSNSRYALMFLPGTYNIDIQIGFYTSVIGLGRTPQDTKIANVICQNGDFDYTGGALDNFWRSAENFYTKPTMVWTNDVSMVWAVSQASPMRRVYVDGELMLWQYNSGSLAGYASGGYLADMTVTGKISSGSQQQYYTRNSNMGSWDGGVWNMVYQGAKGALPTVCPGKYTNIPTTPVIAEKPFIMSEGGKFYLMVPPLKYNSAGASNYADPNIKQIDFAMVYVTDPATDTGASISAKIASGLHVILSPGNYNLKTAIVIAKPDIYVVGIGFPTLISSAGNAVIAVGVNGENVDGVRVAGVLLQAGTQHSPTLLQWGPSASTAAEAERYPGSAANPGILYDIFARVGGPTNSEQVQVSTDSMVQINAGNVIVDDAWLWRADHDVNGAVVDSHNPVKNGIEIYGANVTTYGLAVEHTLADLVAWHGNAGKCYFYQSEYPYDVTQANFGDPGYVSIRVDDAVTDFEAYGIGAYSYFRDHPVTTATGFQVPEGKNGVKVVNSFTIFLNGNGQITHVIDTTGGSVSNANADQCVYVCNFN